VRDLSTINPLTLHFVWKGFCQRMGWKPVTAADVEALITEIEGSEAAQQSEGGTSKGQATAAATKKKNENGKEANSEDGEEDEDEEEEEEVTEVQVGRLLRLFATTNTTTRTSTKTLGTTSGGKMMTHTERDRRKRRRGKRKRGAGRGGGPISTTARGPLGSPSDGSAGLWSRVIAAPNSDSTYQVWDFSSAAEDEDQPPWPLDTPASRALIGTLHLRVSCVACRVSCVVCRVS
jgi:ribosomal protein L12E/L44/L45/RPP1/RPP2